MNELVILNYLNYCRTHKRLSEHSIRAYQNDLRGFIKFESNDIIAYIDYLSKKTKKVSTLKRKIASLKVFFQYLEENNLIKQNILASKRFKFCEEKNLPKTISINDLTTIFDYLKLKQKNATSEYEKEKATRNFLIISLLLSTGLRISELCQLKLTDFNLSSRTLSILGKGKKERLIYIGNDQTYQFLLEYINRYSHLMNPYIFYGNKSSFLSEQSVRLILKTITAKLNLNKIITPHMFRHSFATMLLDNDVDIRYIQQILGHSSIAVTQIYTHVSQQKQQEILSKNNPLTKILSNTF